MDDWFEHLIKETIWHSLETAYADLVSSAHDKVEEKLKALVVGQALSTSPLVQVVAAEKDPGDPEKNATVTLLLRGRKDIPKIGLSPFLRLEIVVSTTVPAGLDPPIDILHWHTVVGDLRVETKNVFTAELAFGWDRGAWLGRGALKIVPAHFGLDVLLGGWSDRGLMIGLDLDFPAPIPLGPTGVALTGIGGDYAYNFIARLEKDGIKPAHPTAEDFVRWARSHEVDRWEQGPLDQTSVGIGLRAGLGDVATNGVLMKLKPIGLSVLTPGPTFVLGGAGELLNTSSIKAEGYAVVDGASASIAMGLGVKVRYPPVDGFVIVEASGTLDAFFSFADPTLWYVNFGTDAAPLQAKVLKLIDAKAYLMLNNERVQFGASIMIGDEWKLWIVKFVAKMGAEVRGFIGWNPVQLEAMFKILGQLGLAVWEFDFMVTVDAAVTGRIPHPTQLDFKVHYNLDLPWPIPDIEGEAHVDLGEDSPTAPTLTTPLLSDPALPADRRMPIGAIHAVTGRQWQLDHTAAGAVSNPWPDLEIVLPFGQRVTDDTMTVIGPAIPSTRQGAYDVSHHIKKIELRNLVTDTVVGGVRGVWAAGPGGESARLHLLGVDPFAWLSPHTDTATWAHLSNPGPIQQGFGLGPDRPVATGEKFGGMRVHPSGPARLTTDFEPALPARVLRTDAAGDLRLTFEDGSGGPLTVDRVTLLLVLPRRWSTSMTTGGAGLKLSGAKVVGVEDLHGVYGDLALVAVELALPAPADHVDIGSDGHAPLMLFAVRYHVVAKVESGSFVKTLLTPSHYRLTIEGETTATHGAGLPDANTVGWAQAQDFWVNNPETLRPYIRTTTVGDPRIFLDDHAWNPSMFGFGFPAYRNYRPVVRFLVPYLSGIFDHLRMRIAYEQGPELRVDVVPSPAIDGLSSLPPQSLDWYVAHGSVAPPDQELVFPAALPQGGAAAVTLRYALPDGQEIRLDDWSACVSRFTSFRDHLSWPAACLTVLHGPAGTTVQPACLTLHTPAHHPWDLTANRLDGAAAVLGGRAIETTDRVVDLDARATRAGAISAVVSHAGLLNPGAPGGHVFGFPEELSGPPLDWRLPPPMAAQLAPLDRDTGVRFGRFASLSNAHFGDGTADRLAGLGDTVAATRVDAVVDELGRPYALWLRTPEPVDWRRVQAHLTVAHVEQSGACPTGYAHRRELGLDVEILPGTDASSAFLVGSLAGARTRLPRGEYVLTLTFSAVAAGLPSLRPDPVVGGPVETVVLRFLQPSGLDWPLPSGGIVVPHKFFELLTEVLELDPGPIHQLLVDAEAQVADEQRARAAAVQEVVHQLEARPDRVLRGER